MSNLTASTPLALFFNTRVCAAPCMNDYQANTVYTFMCLFVAVICLMVLAYVDGRRNWAAEKLEQERAWHRRSRRG